MNLLLAIYVWAAACLNCAGWLLASLGQLNAMGCALALLPGMILAWLCLRKIPAGFSPRKYFRRCRRPLPAIFLFVVGLVFLGGFLYAPSNFDALTYRLPRLLNWLQAGKWFWISTINERQNWSGVAWEWTALPFLALARSDRGMFLINALGFLLMPGLLFAVFRRLGVARKVAWTWMWLLPLAYGYVTQAGSIGNDLLGALFCLLSVYFGLRARRSEKVSDVWLAILAAALLTGTKFSNLPLALPCLVAVWPGLKFLRRNLAGSCAVAALSVVVSALPLMALNQLYAGSWNGDPRNEYKMQIHNPVAGVLGNGFLVAEQAFLPPVLPGSNKIHTQLTDRLPRWLKENFPRLLSARLNELPAEEGAGVGLTTTLPLLLGLGFALVRFRGVGGGPALFPPVVLAAWVAFLVYLAKMGSEAGPRLLLPYYPLVLVPFLLLRAQTELLRWRAWRIFLVLTALAVLPVLVLSVARPLWPAQRLTARLAAAHPHSRLIQRLATTCTAYASRNDILAPLRAALPDDARAIGFIAGSNDSSYALWRPFGRRRVTDLRPQISSFLAHPETCGCPWVVVKAEVWPDFCAQPLADWAAAHHVRLVWSQPIVQLVSAGPQTWCVLQLASANVR
jgi:hypothetical protein